MYKYHAPLDPECPEVADCASALLNDPMTEAMCAPVYDIFEAFEKRHRRTCKRCQKYGCANIEVVD